jgi:2-isopropylmalate synthase
MKIVHLLDDMGMDYIEAGNPGSNPKDIQFFEILKNTKLKNSKVVAFGSTRRRGLKVEEDENIQILNNCGVDTICVFGKSWDFQVTDIIKTRLNENLKMIEDSVRFLTDNGKEVFFDAEHFYDGYKENKEYALKTLDAAIKGGATKLILCETRGGMLSEEASQITKEVVESYSVPIGVHFHNDCGVAVASSLMSVSNGATQVQGTFIGFGERCGNADLISIACNLKFKMNIDCLLPEAFETLTQRAHELGEIANQRIPGNRSFVGRSAFAHKGGMHIDGIRKNPKSFEHM